jgi:hypothetical protein
MHTLVNRRSLAVLAFLTLAVAGMTLRDSTAAQRQPTAATAAGPDLSGVWMLREISDTYSPDPMPLQPWAVEQARAVADTRLDTDPELKCFPPGVPRIYLHRYPMEILQVRDRIIQYFEYDHIVRQIWTDGRPHPKSEELDDSWMGHSIGHWEKDALVVDTVGQNEKSWIDNSGHPHSSAFRVVERIRRPDRETLQVDFTFEDPKAFTKPWNGQKTFRLRPGWAISEHLCADNFLWKEPGK